jgi:hypothetical protein
MLPEMYAEVSRLNSLLSSFLDDPRGAEWIILRQVLDKYAVRIESGRNWLTVK